MDKRNRTLIKKFGELSRGSMFVKNVDASVCMKTKKKLLELLNSLVKEIGEQNVGQLIMDNESNYLLAGKNYF